MFGIDPTLLLKIPYSEYHKRRLYYLEWRKANEGDDTTEHDGITVTEEGFKPGSHDIVVE